MPEANCKSLKTIHEAPLTVSVSEATDSDGSIFNPGSSPEPVFGELVLDILKRPRSDPDSWDGPRKLELLWSKNYRPGPS